MPNVGLAVPGMGGVPHGLIIKPSSLLMKGMKLLHEVGQDLFCFFLRMIGTMKNLGNNRLEFLFILRCQVFLCIHENAGLNIQKVSCQCKVTLQLFCSLLADGQNMTAHVT